MKKPSPRHQEEEPAHAKVRLGTQHTKGRSFIQVGVQAAPKGKTAGASPSPPSRLSSQKKLTPDARLTRALLRERISRSASGTRYQRIWTQHGKRQVQQKVPFTVPESLLDAYHHLSRRAASLSPGPARTVTKEKLALMRKTAPPCCFLSVPLIGAMTTFLAAPSFCERHGSALRKK